MPSPKSKKKLKRDMQTNETNPYLEKVEKLAEQLHIWYLEATKKLNPESYNPDAQKSYYELIDEQRFIDRYIAQKVIEQRSDKSER